MVGKTVMTELMADLILSLKPELVRLLGDILTPQQRRLMNNREERDIKLRMWEPRPCVSVCVCVCIFLSLHMRI